MQSKAPTPLDSRLSVNTLIREDIFAGFMGGDMERFSQGEKTIERLLAERPDDRPVLLAWKGGATLYRAVLAAEANRDAEFQKQYRQAVDLFAEAKRIANGDLGVVAAIGGSYVIFADRLPKEHRAAAWSEAYESYRRLRKQQAGGLSELPRHLRGELLGGLAQTAQRTGRSREAEEYVDRILTSLPGTAYAEVAQQWKTQPGAAAEVKMTCLTCHNPGRLAARRAMLEKE
jgi:hypothetical protein